MTRALLMAAALACAAAPAHTLTLTLGGVEIPGRGFFSLEPVDLTETFDLADGSCGLSPGNPLQIMDWDSNPASGDPAAVAAFRAAETPLGHPGAIVRGDAAGRYKAPASDASCYLAATNMTLTLSADIEYLGFHWASIDEYNTIEPCDWFYCRDGGWSGQDIWSLFGIAPYGDQYVNIYLDEEDFPSGPFDWLPLGWLFTSRNNWAFEIDNISIRYRGSSGIAAAAGLSARATAGVGDVRDVPAPGALALFGLGLAGLAAGRARRGPAAQG